MQLDMPELARRPGRPPAYFLPTRGVTHREEAGIRHVKVPVRPIAKQAATEVGGRACKKINNAISTRKRRRRKAVAREQMRAVQKWEGERRCIRR